MQKENLIKVFPMYVRYYIICDPQGDYWFFKEDTGNGFYPKYTLKGIHYPGMGWLGSHLFCKFICEAEDIEVFIEDIFTAKKNNHIGTWMGNRLIRFLKGVSPVVKVGRIYGKFGPANGYEENKMRRENFFRRFGFDINEGSLSAELNSLHEIPLQNIVEIEAEDILKEWTKNKIRGCED